ncbi:MAG: hypothetical protein AAGD25_14785 [Cyanobacteria bacterium P01_F01_bin.150]
MPAKSELQTILKEQYGINKNISQALTAKDCEELLFLLQDNPLTRKLVDSYAATNARLGNNNRQFGQQRYQAERKLGNLKQDYEKLEGAIADLETKNVQLEQTNTQLEQTNTELEQVNTELSQRKQFLAQEKATLESEIQTLANYNKGLKSKVQGLTADKAELTEANKELKQDNKDLKNIVDQIRLRLAKDMNELLQYEDSQIRRAMIRLFRWTLG